jgi:glutaminase
MENQAPAALPTDLAGKPAYVSTGHLPPPEVVTTLVSEAHERFKSNTEGENSKVYPALARVQSDLFGVCVVGTSGNVYAVGDAEYEFTIMSVSKPFLFALVCWELGVEEVRQKIGVNATGRAFNSLEGIERTPDGRTNPMVNSGAIATTSLVPGSTFETKWKFIHEGLSRFAGRTLPLNDEVYTCASETNYRNQSIARMLQSYARIYIDPAQAVDPLHETVRPERERQGSGRHGRHTGQRRGKSDHEGAGGGSGRLPLRTRRDDHRRFV